ncbi:MAG TPA: bacillithiol biosynthesis BshC, partial [Chitinophagaceae bacterium]|nr:bacillithiol biosynthesis BshC [Chitinophagaceae bacterium]
MLFSNHQLPYRSAYRFSPIVLDYLDREPFLEPFRSSWPTPEGIAAAIQRKQEQSIDRDLLYTALTRQYEGLSEQEAVTGAITALKEATTFTVCTAHQPNLATGPLYFIYKILHAVQLARQLAATFPNYRFVPVYYMGCEDADLDELNHFFVEGKKYVWETGQTGAVGRMTVDAQLSGLLAELEQQLSVYPFGRESMALLRRCYRERANENGDRQTILRATLELVHELFGRYGLVVLVPDTDALKRTMIPVFREELLQQQSAGMVAGTSSRLNERYKVQAHARDINLFYLKDNIRERIEKEGAEFRVVHTEIRFTQEELLQELDNHPDRFSPNVILRGLYQET